MPEIEVKSVHRIVQEFVSGADFVITNFSLGILADYVAARLESDPTSAEALSKNVRRARDRALNDKSPSADFVVVDGRRVRLFHERDAGIITSDCDNFPQI